MACLKQFMAQLRHEIGNMLKILRSDKGNEFISVEFNSYLEQLEVKQEFTTSYTQKQNGVYEIDNQTIMEVARSMLYANNIHIQFWGEVVNAIMYVLNRIWTRTLDGIAPSEAWFQIKFSMAHKGLWIKCLLSCCQRTMTQIITQEQEDINGLFLHKQSIQVMGC